MQDLFRTKATTELTRLQILTIQIHVGKIANPPLELSIILGM